MNKTELIADVTKQTGLSKKDATAAVNAVFASIVSNAKDGVVIPNFGKFSVKKVAARTGKNALTGKPMSVAAHNRLSFKAYQAFKNAIQ